MHVEGEDALVALEDLLVQRGYLVALVVGVFVDVADACSLVGECSAYQSVVAVVLIADVAMSLHLRHLRLAQIAVAVVLAFRHVRLFQLAVLREAHKLVLADGILRHHLLHGAVESHDDGILVVGTHGEVEHTDVARTTLIVDQRHLHTGKVVHIHPAAVALYEVAMFLFEFVEEILQVTLQHSLCAVRTHRDVGRVDELAGRRDADQQFGADAIELTTEIVVFAIVRLSPLCPVGSLQLGAHAVQRALQGYALQQGTPGFRLCPEDTGHQQREYARYTSFHTACKITNNYQLSIINCQFFRIFARKLRKL